MKKKKKNNNNSYNELECLTLFNLRPYIKYIHYAI